MGKTGIDEIRFTFRCHLNCTAKPPVANIRLLSVTCSHVYRIHKDRYTHSQMRGLAYTIQKTMQMVVTICIVFCIICPQFNSDFNCCTFSFPHINMLTFGYGNTITPNVVLLNLLQRCGYGPDTNRKRYGYRMAMIHLQCCGFATERLRSGYGA